MKEKNQGIEGGFWQTTQRYGSNLIELGRAMANDISNLAVGAICFPAHLFHHPVDTLTKAASVLFVAAPVIPIVGPLAASIYAGYYAYKHSFKENGNENSALLVGMLTAAVTLVVPAAGVAITAFNATKDVGYHVNMEREERIGAQKKCGVATEQGGTLQMIGSYYSGAKELRNNFSMILSNALDAFMAVFKNENKVAALKTALVGATTPDEVQTERELCQDRFIRNIQNEQKHSKESLDDKFANVSGQVAFEAMKHNISHNLGRLTTKTEERGRGG